MVLWVFFNIYCIIIQRSLKEQIVLCWTQIRTAGTSLLARWCVKSPASRLFSQPFVHAQIKDNIKTLRHWPLWRKPTLICGFSVQRATNTENVTIWWRHHGLASTHTHTHIYIYCWKKSKLKSFVRPWFHGCNTISQAVYISQKYFKWFTNSRRITLKPQKHTTSNKKCLLQYKMHL